jgi:hypothetical protein
MQRDPAGYVDGMNVYEYLDGTPFSSFDPRGLADIAIAAEGEATGAIGGAGEIGVVVDTDNLWDSGITVSGGASFGPNVGVGVGIQGTTGELEGIGHEMDTNLLPGIPTSVQIGASGIHPSIGASFGPGTGISGSRSYTKTLSAGNVYNATKKRQIGSKTN